MIIMVTPLLDILEGTEESDGGFEWTHYGYRTLAACITMVMTLVGVAGNSLVILAVFLSNKLQTTTNVFVASLAATDLLNCLFFPVQVVSLLHRDGPPPIGGLCGVAGAIVVTSSVASIVLLTLIAINRWMKITRSHDTYCRVHSPRNLVLMLAFSWSYPVVAMILPQLAGLGSLGYSHRYKTCLWSDEQANDIFMPMIMAFSAITAFLVITVCYISIALHVRKQTRKIKALTAQNNSTSLSLHTSRNQIARTSVSHISAVVSTHNDPSMRVAEPEQRPSPWNRREMKVTKNLAVVVCVYFVFVLPYGVCSVIPGSYVPFICFSILLMSNSIMNPIIYAFKHPVFSKVFLCILRCRFGNISEPSRGLRFILRHR